MNATSSMGQSDANALTAAADILRSGSSLPANINGMLSDLLRAEAVMFENLSPLVDLLNILFTQEGGGEAHLKLMRDEVGNIRLIMDNTSNARRIAAAILNAHSDCEDS